MRLRILDRLIKRVNARTEHAGGGELLGRGAGKLVSQPDADVGLCVGNLGAEAFTAPSFACHAAHVRVDRETGVVRVLRVAAVHDPGTVINAIAAHHQEVEYTCQEAPIVQIADAISASRPGARGETMDTYMKRLTDLQEIADGFPGVEKSFAVQAGREVRILVRPEEVGVTAGGAMRDRGMNPLSTLPDDPMTKQAADAVVELADRVSQRFGYGELPIEVHRRAKRRAQVDRVRFERILGNLLDKVAVLAGLVPLKSSHAAHFMANEVPGVVVPEPVGHGSVTPSGRVHSTMRRW